MCQTIDRYTSYISLVVVDYYQVISVLSVGLANPSHLVPCQAVIQNPFSNGGSPVGETLGGETRFAYFPATAVSDGTVSVQTTSDPTQAGGESPLLLTLG